MTTKLKNRCTVTLKQEGSIIGTYRPTQKKFHSLQKKLEPFRTLYPIYNTDFIYYRYGAAREI